MSQDTKKSFKNFLWPETSDLKTAISTSRYGFWASVFIAAVTCLMAVLGGMGQDVLKLGFDYWALVDAGLFALIAFGIWKLSRTAAVCGLALYAAERVYMWSLGGGRGTVVVIIVTLAFIHGIRGTFAYHKLIASKPEHRIE